MDAFSLLLTLTLALPLLACDPAPHITLTDLNVFPPAAVCRENWQRLSTIYLHAERRREEAAIEGVRGYDAWRRECGRVWLHLEAWRLLDDAANAQVNVECRLRLLRELRELIGCEAYYGGFMPAAIP